MNPKAEMTFNPPNENEVSNVNHHLSLSEVREMVFLESLRQQLAQFSGVSLVCPFQQRGRTCCGFGHYMRAIWEQVRPEHRSVKAVLHPKTGKEIIVRPPRTACLHYGLG
jgi:Fe-S oxidoreductase